MDITEYKKFTDMHFALQMIEETITYEVQYRIMGNERQLSGKAIKIPLLFSNYIFV